MTTPVPGIHRRQLLAALAAGSSALAGCSGVLPGSGCDGMHSTRIAFESAELTDEQASHVRPVVYDDLPSAQQDLVQKGFDGGYETCDPSHALESLVDRVSDSIDRQRHDYPSEPEDVPQYLLSAYLRRDGTLHCTTVIEGDLAVSPCY